MSVRFRWNGMVLVSILFATGAMLGQVREDEGERRERRAGERDAYLADRLGTTDLRDLKARAARLGAKAIAQEKKKPLTAATWTNLGPLFSPTFTSPVGIATAGQDDTGITTAIAPHPTDPKTILVGAAGGGVWKTVDGGATWRAVTENVGVLQIGAVAYSKSNPNRVYAGTGCGDSSTTKIGNPGFLKVGVGILVSNDGGETWQLSSHSPGAYFWALSVDPANPDIVLAGTDQGVQRSTDGGASWTGAFTSLGLQATALSRCDANPSVVFAGVYNPGSVAGSILKSTDGGATFTASPDNALPTPLERRGRVQVAVSPTDPNRAYALIANIDSTQAEGAKTVDGGATWSSLDLVGKNVNVLSTQGNFANVVAVSPASPDTVFFGGLDLWRSTNGGDAWEKISDWSAPTNPPGPLPYAHSDQHAIVFGVDGTMYIGSDGGISVYDPATKRFNAINQGILSYLVDHVCASPTGDVLLAGAQDNGTAMRTPGSTTWGQVGPADGYSCVVNRTNSNIVTVSGQNENILRSTDGGKTFVDAQGVTEAGGPNAKFSTLLPSHPTEASTIFTATKKKIWRSDDSGATWREISTTMPLIGDIHDFTVSPSDGNRLVLVDADKRVVESTDGGTSWALRGEFPGSSPSVVRLDKDDAQKMWIAASDPTPQKEHLWVSTDRGASWVAISGTGRTDGLPDLPVFSFERDPRDGRVLWAGSFTGLYRSGDAGASWQRHGTGLPNVPVPDIAFTSDGTTIFAGTAGRGIWQVSSAAATGVRAEAGPTAPPAVDFTFAPSNPLPGHVVDFTDRSLGEPATWRWDFGDGSQASTLESPEHIYTDPGRYTVKLEVSNNAGRAQLSKQVVVAYADTGTGDILTYLIPVILTSAGQGGTSFSTELTLTNRSGQDLNLTFHTTGTFNATSTFSLPPGQRIDPDVFTFLKDQTGMTVPAGNVVTSLRIEVRGATKLGQFGAQVRVTTPPAADLAAQGISGRFGLAFPALPLGTGAQTTAIVYGLQQTSSPGQAGARSNLACVNAGPSNVPLELKVTYVNGDTGLSHPSTDSFVLAAWQFDQKGQPLATRGITHGYAKITKVTGEDQFVCYGVVNDNLNGDGSFVPMVIADAHASSSDVVVPVIVGTDKFHSELTIANRSQFTLAGTFELIPASGAVPQFGDIEIGAGAQSTIPDIVSALRDLGFDAPPGTVASLHFEFEHSTAGAGKNEPLEGDHVTDDLAYVGVRTYAEKAGGLFGLAYGGVPVGSAADTEAFVYGLQQSNGTRANVAVVHALGGHLEPLVLEVSYFGPQGSELGNDPQCSPCTLLPGQWKQFNSPLAAYGAPHGYARIRRISGSDQFIAYGVLNDNANDDGSYVPMIVP